MNAAAVQTESLQLPSETAIRLLCGRDLDGQLGRLERYVSRFAQVPLSRHPGWLKVLEKGLAHKPYCLEAVDGNRMRGMLPLAYVSSFLFGRFLVSLPYLNHGGVIADDEPTLARLIDHAVVLADQLGVRYLELRQGEAIDHPALSQRLSSKVHMRLPLPAASEVLWKQLSAKVRNQIRKGQKCGLTVAWGGRDLLADFYRVFSRNMRDLGTPTYGKKFFAAILDQFPVRSELCVVHQGKQAVAGALLLHGWGVTEVPSASSLREANSTCANMLMYWHLLERAIERGQAVFDFGRSTRDSSTFRFKAQWGAEEAPAHWQYYVRQGTISDMRPENPRYQKMIRIWRKMPVALTRLVGPCIVRGIP